MCTVFLSKAELKSAVHACLRMSQKGGYSYGPHGAIGEWDVSRVTDMSGMFSGANSFDDDISQWDVSSAADVSGMFFKATAFDGDLCHHYQPPTTTRHHHLPSPATTCDHLPPPSTTICHH